MHRHIQTTNAIESLFGNVRQRTDQIDVFTTESSCLTIVWAIIQETPTRMMLDIDVHYRLEYIPCLANKIGVRYA